MSGAPVPEVSKRVEEGLIEMQRKNARNGCRELQEEFVECTRTGIFSVVWRCKPLQNQLNECYRPYTSQEVLDQMKRDYVAERHPRRP
jgi:hypothetical protein